MDLLENIDPEQSRIDDATARLVELVTALPSNAERVVALNKIRMALHEVSPLRHEPVDCVQWVRAEQVQANDYNPNTVAPPEMELLQRSIESDGYTQPIVTWATEGGVLEVVDGFHRHRVGRESPEVRERILHFLPVVVVNESRTDRGDRIAATIRHNRARGKHRIDSMSAIVVELKRRNWSDEKIGRELGMDPDEVLRLSQISGLAEMFADREFSEAWEIASIDETDALDPDAEG
jgi:ParB-like chromosome segregation protein Spo0J